MLEKIELKDFASYDNSGVVLDNLSKINFVYGTNGCGKTTISNYLGDSNNTNFLTSSLKWENDTALKTVVYNKQFRISNFRKSDIAGIFTLGNATKDDLDKLDNKKNELTDLQKEIIARKKSKEQIEKNCDSEKASFKEIVWKSIFKKDEEGFKEAFAGVQTKDKFAAKLIEKSRQTPVSQNSGRKSIEEKSKVLFGKTPQKIDALAIIDYTSLIKVEKDEIWNKKIVGKQDINISKLIERLNNMDWINEGRQYIQESDVCPFCQQHTIGEDFRREISSFFDEEYDQTLESIKSNIVSYGTELSKFINQIDKIIEGKNEKVNIDTFIMLRNSFENTVKHNLDLMQNKLKSPSDSVSLIDISDICLQIVNLVNEANESIKEHNKLVDNYQIEKSKLVGEIWSLLVEENSTLINEYSKKIKGFESGLQSIQNVYGQLIQKKGTLTEDIKNESKNVTSVQPSVDEMNRILRNYGFTSFSIVPSESLQNHYQIQREDGSLAETTLSEGEETFITFLYFLQSVKGGNSENDVLDDRIIVVDDPISSLDSSILFVVSSLLKDVLKDIISNKGAIKQAIILTHNVYFHKEITFFGNGNDPRKEIRYWILRKKYGITNVEEYGMSNPISSSYELLWKELKEINRNSGITVQNIMRRIIENYFKLLGNYKDETIIQKFPDYESQNICRSLLCWVNDGSHCLPDDLFVEWPIDLIDKYQEVFRKIFEYTNQICHYNMMMGIEKVD